MLVLWRQCDKRRKATRAAAAVILGNRAVPLQEKITNTIIPSVCILRFKSYATESQSCSEACSYASNWHLELPFVCQWHYQTDAWTFLGFFSRA